MSPLVLRNRTAREMVEALICRMSEREWDVRRRARISCISNWQRILACISFGIEKNKLASVFLAHKVSVVIGEWFKNDSVMTHCERGRCSARLSSAVLVRERIRRKGSPTRLLLRGGSGTLNAGRCGDSSGWILLSGVVTFELVRLNDCARRKALDPLGSLAAQKSLDTDIMRTTRK